MGLRVLLVHANPFQAVLPVPPYGLERIRTAVMDLPDVEVRIYDPWLHADEPVAAAAELAAEFQPDLVGLGIRIIDDCIVIDKLDGDEVSDVAFFLPQVSGLVRALQKVAPRATFVCGGAAFSSMPRHILDYLKVDLGVVGAGEASFRQLVRRLAAGQPIGKIPGLVHRTDTEPLGAYQLAFPPRTVARLDHYSTFNNIPVRTRIGCAMSCAYCLTANMRRTHQTGDVSAVLAELEALAVHAEAVGAIEVPVMFADDEVNLPGDRSVHELLSALAERPDITARLNWRGYFNPVPFDEELAELTKATNGHICLTVDTASERVMKASGKPFRRRHLDQVISLFLERKVSFNAGLIFGLPGEDEETMRESISWAKSLPSDIIIDYAPGARVYPDTPLAAEARRTPHLTGGDPGFLDVAVYSASRPPRELARYLDEQFAGHSNIQRIGDGYARADRSPSRLARLLLRPDPVAWRALMESFVDEKSPRGTTNKLRRAENAALWQRRYELAEIAAEVHTGASFLEQGLRDSAARRLEGYRATVGQVG